MGEPSVEGRPSSSRMANNVEANDAEEYVNSVMSQHNMAVQRTPLPSGRKRSLSASALSETEVKKHRADSEGKGQTFRPVAKARRNLMRGDSTSAGISTPDDSPNKGNGSGKGKAVSSKGKGAKKTGKSLQKSDSSSVCSRENEAESIDSSDVKNLLKKLSQSMQTMHEELNRKIDSIESKIEQSEKRITEKVIDKVSKIMDKRVNTESTKLRKEIDDRISSLRADFLSELEDLNEKIEASNRVAPQTNGSDIRLQVVVRNLPQAINENVEEKVNSLIKEGLKIRDVRVESAERKESRTERIPGVVIAKFKCNDDKRRVMASKKMLRGHRQYNNVYINHDQTKDERILARNMRTLVNGVKRGQEMRVLGNRVVTYQEPSGSEGWRQREPERSQQGRPNEVNRARDNGGGYRDSDHSRRADGQHNRRNDRATVNNGYSNSSRVNRRHY